MASQVLHVMVTTTQQNNISKLRVVVVTVIALFLFVVITNTEILSYTIHIILWSIIWMTSQISLFFKNLGFPVDWSQLSFKFTWAFREFAVTSLIYCILILWLFYSFAHISPKDLGFRRAEKRKGVIFWIISATIFCAAVLVVYAVAINIASSFGYELFKSPAVLGAFSFRDMLIRFVWGPTVEELVFRGILINVLAMIMGWKPVIIIIDGALFAVIHFSYGNSDPFNFVGGYFLAWVFYTTRSLFLPCIFHSLGNLFCFSLNAIETFYPGLLKKLITSLTIIGHP